VAEIEALAALDAAPGGAWNDRAAAVGEVVALVGVQLGRSAPWPARRRRQQVMPVRSTNRIPVRAARSFSRGRPPFGLGGSGGISGSMIAHKASETKGFQAIALLLPASAVDNIPSARQHGCDTAASPAPPPAVRPDGVPSCLFSRSSRPGSKPVGECNTLRNVLHPVALGYISCRQRPLA